MTKFPFGVASFGFPVIGGGSIRTTGNVFFVDSTAPQRADDLTHGRAPETPFATVDFAVGQCQANSGDVILVLPGHSETLISAAALNADVNGISIIGISYNEGRDRPMLTLSANTGASIDVNGTNVTIENFVIDMTGVDGLVAGINVKAADFCLRGCEIILANPGNQALIGIKTNANAARMRVINCYFHGANTPGGNAAILLTGSGTADGIEIAGCRFVADCAQAAIFNDTGMSCTNLYVHHNVAVMISGSPEYFCFINDTGTTGLIAHNEVVGPDLTVMIVLSNVGGIENYGFVEGSNTQVGQLIPVVGTGLAADHTLVDQVLGAYMSGAREQHFVVTADFSQAAWNTTGTHAILNLVNGEAYRLRILPICITDLAGATATISLGTKDNTSAFIPATLATDIDVGEIWLSTTPAKQILLSGNSSVPGLMIDAIVSNINNDNRVGFEILVAALTGGVIKFFIWWEHLVNTASGLNVPPTVGTGSTM